MSGRGSSPAHHGEVLQGVFEDSSGRLVRALVTLPCGGFGSEARFESGPGDLTVEPVDRSKARHAALQTIRYLDEHGRNSSGECGGRLSVSGGAPVGWGMGSSTSDVVASIQAVADSSGEELAPETIAWLAVEAEGASDPVMFGDRVLLFAHREGRIVDDLGGKLPPLEVVGVCCDSDSNGAVETLDLPGSRYDRHGIAAFATLLRLLRRAVRERNARLVGEVASASARINQCHLPKPGFERLMEVARRTGAVGLNVAHSGCVAGMLFDPGDPVVEYRTEEARRSLARLRLESWRFNTGDSKQSSPSDKANLGFWKGA